MHRTEVSQLQPPVGESGSSLPPKPQGPGLSYLSPWGEWVSLESEEQGAVSSWMGDKRGKQWWPRGDPAPGVDGGSPSAGCSDPAEREG